jgi:hypothetical protein
MIPPDAAGLAMLETQLAAVTYDCVVIGGGMRLPPKGLVLFEQVVNAIHKAAPGAAIAFNTPRGHGRSRSPLGKSGMSTNAAHASS